MPKLTKRTLDAIPPTADRLFLWDSEMRGFGVLALKSGARSFIVQYRNAAGRSRRLTLGRYGAITIDIARELAREALTKVARGGDPVAEARGYRQAPDMNELFDEYVKKHLATQNAPSTRKDVERLLNKHLRPRLGAIKVNDFKRADAAKLHSAMKGTPRRANHALAILSKALSLAEVWGLRPENTNPCGVIERYAENKRTRFLSDEELQRLGDAIHEAETIGLPWRLSGKAERSPRHPNAADNRAPPMSWQKLAAIRLLLLTGARRGEIASLKWIEVDHKSQTIALPSAKGGERSPHPVSATIFAVLDALPRAKNAIFVLPSSSDPKRHMSAEVVGDAWDLLRWRAGIPEVHLHDARHTVGTYAGQLKVSGFIVRDLLRHRNISTTDRYANFDDDPVREVSNKVGERILASISKRSASN